VTRGQLPQRAGLPGLNSGGAAAAVPPPLTHAYCQYLLGCLLVHRLGTRFRSVATGPCHGQNYNNCWTEYLTELHLNTSLMTHH